MPKGVGYPKKKKKNPGEKSRKGMKPPKRGKRKMR